MNKIYVLLFFFFIRLTISHCQVPPLVAHHDLESEKSDFPWTNQQTLIKGDAYSGESFSRTDSLNLYGIGWKGAIPEQFQHKNIHISISGFARLIGMKGNVSLVISVLQNDSTIYWEGRAVSSQVKQENVWTLLQNEVSLPMNITGANNTLLIYIWNEDGKRICDIDELSFTFSEAKFPTYLIPGDTVSFQEEDLSYIEVYSGKYFNMEYDKFSGHFRILGPDKRVYLHSFSFYTSWSEPENKSGEVLENLKTTFFLRSDSISEQGSYFTLETRSDIGETKIQLLFSDTEPLLNVSMVSTFLRSLRLLRQSLSASFEPELKAVYRNSSKTDTALFQEEYWLRQGGFQAFSDSTGFIIYHPEHISSLQLNPHAQRMTVNLDWEMDHPLLHWPLLKESENLKENYSSSLINKGSVLSCQFTIQGTPKFRKFPLLMKYPYGRCAAILWTEHADYSDLLLQRAVNFGSDSIVMSTAAIAGFVKNKIPVTKSVFYANPDAVNNSVKAGFLSSEIANVSGTPGFREFLHDLEKQGQEICLHTPDQFTTSRGLLEDALADMKNDFNCVNWIDHGYDNARKSNRENLVCDGLDEKSRYYSADLWQKYGVKYFWNCFYEDTSLYTPYAFNSFLSLPYSGWGDRFPVPEYWQHSTRSGDFVHWRTTGTLDPPDGDLWNYYFSDARLQDLIYQRGTSVLHVYPARADSTNGFYEMKEGHFQIQESFEKILQRQSILRDEGLLHLSTVRDYLDYQLALEQVEVHLLMNGKVNVENKSGVDLKGLSFIISSGMVDAGGKSIQMRQFKNEIFFWFDLNKGESLEMKLIPE